MIGLITAAIVIAIFVCIFLAFYAGAHVKSNQNPPPVCAPVGPVPSMLDQKKMEVEGIEKEVFAKADLIQKLVKGLVPFNGAAVSKPKTRPLEPADPETHPPDETGYLKAITDKVEQIKRLSTKK